MFCLFYHLRCSTEQAFKGTSLPPVQSSKSGGVRVYIHGHVFGCIRLRKYETGCEVVKDNSPALKASLASGSFKRTTKDAEGGNPACVEGFSSTVIKAVSVAMPLTSCRAAVLYLTVFSAVRWNSSCTLVQGCSDASSGLTA